jgi:hypothetical protein
MSCLLIKRSVGVRVPPNLSKILYAWGLRDELSNATRCRKTGFHSSEHSHARLTLLLSHWRVT